MPRRNDPDLAETNQENLLRQYRKLWYLNEHDTLLINENTTGKNVEYAMTAEQIASGGGGSEIVSSGRSAGSL